MPYSPSFCFTADAKSSMVWSISWSRSFTGCQSALTGNWSGNSSVTIAKYTARTSLLFRIAEAALENPDGQGSGCHLSRWQA